MATDQRRRLRRRGERGGAGHPGTLADGTIYENEAIQWGTLRWGRLVTDVIQEDTVLLMEAARRRAEAKVASRGVTPAFD